MNDDYYYEIPHDASDGQYHPHPSNRPYPKRHKSRKPLIFGFIALALAAAVGVLAIFTVSLKMQLSEKDTQLENQSKTVEQYKKAAEDWELKYNEEKQKSKEWQEKYENLSAAKAEDKKICYLTFDDGPSENTLKILDILKRYNAKATFFVIGSGKTEYMKNIVDSGNAIALHSYTHDYKKIYASENAFFDDLGKIGSLVKQKTGVETKLIRFPGGSSNTISDVPMKTLAQAAEDRGYIYFDWNCDSGDAGGNNVAPEKLVQHIKNDTGSQKRLTVLMHDTAAKSTTVTALPDIIEYLSSKGYVFDVLGDNAMPCHHSIGR